tara:strand:+ start:1962 stop:2234 length:273 start_codon:yes stop_codon:yes gene_type:complete
MSDNRTMAYIQTNSPFKKQKLSAKASKDKADRDLAYANGPYKKKRAENQKKRRAAIKNGKNLSGLDFDHTTNTFTTVRNNRGGFGKGTNT